MSSLARPFALFVLLAAGCGINSRLNKIENEYDKTVDLVCECSNVFPDRTACEDMFSSPFSFFDRDCLEDALAEDKSGSKATLDCTLDQAKAYRSCIEDKLDCNDGTSIMGCESAFMTDCPRLPAAVEEKAAACATFND